MEKRELIAMAKIGIGSARVVSGVLTGFGHGIVGAYCRSHHLTYLGRRLAKASVEGGTQMIDKGLQELQEARAQRAKA